MFDAQVLDVEKRYLYLDGFEIEYGNVRDFSGNPISRKVYVQCSSPDGGSRATFAIAESKIQEILDCDAIAIQVLTIKQTEDEDDD